MQGFTCDVDRASRGLRFTPLASAATLGAATLMDAPFLFLAFAAMALAGAVGVHLFDLLFDRVVRHALGAPPLPANPTPRRFAMFVASALSLVASALSATGLSRGSFAVGAFLTAAALLSGSTHFCLGSWFFYRAGGTLRRLGG